MRRGFSPVVARATLAEETHLFRARLVRAPQLGETFRESGVALSLELDQLTACDPVQYQRVLVETLRHSGALEVGERTDRVKTEPLTRRGNVLAAEHPEG
jgi:hypothetical protein